MDYYEDIKVVGRCLDSGELVTRTLPLVAYAPAPPGMHMRVVTAVEKQELSDGPSLSDVQGELDCRTADPLVSLYRWTRDGKTDFMKLVAAPSEGVKDGNWRWWVLVQWSGWATVPIVAWATHEVDTGGGSRRVALPVGLGGGSWLVTDVWGAAQAARVAPRRFIGTELIHPDEPKPNDFSEWFERYARSEQARVILPRMMGLGALDGAS